MPNIVLDRYEAEGYWLPNTCIVCGEPTDDFKRKTFSCTPIWAYLFLLCGGLLPLLIAIWATRKWMRTYLPVCEQHRNHWLWRSMILTMMFFSSFGAIIILSIMDEKNPKHGNLTAIGALSGLVIFLVLFFIFHFTSVRVRRITDDGISFIGVSQNFVDEVERKRETKAPDEEGYNRYLEPERLPTSPGASSSKHASILRQTLVASMARRKFSRF